MVIRRVAAIIYAIVSLGIVAFQLALAAGAPWGAYAMGGAFQGQFPPALRMAAIIQAVLLVGVAAVILARAGLIFPKWSRVSRWLAWVVVAFSAISFVLNLITPSAGERVIWAPTALFLLISSAIAAFSSSSETSARYSLESLGSDPGYSVVSFFCSLALSANENRWPLLYISAD